MGRTTAGGFVLAAVLLLAVVTALLLTVTNVLNGAVGLIVVLALCAAFLVGLNIWLHQMRVRREAARDLYYKNRRNA